MIFYHKVWSTKNFKILLELINHQLIISKNYQLDLKSKIFGIYFEDYYCKFYVNNIYHKIMLLLHLPYPEIMFSRPNIFSQPISTLAKKISTSFCKRRQNMVTSKMTQLQGLSSGHNYLANTQPGQAKHYLSMRLLRSLCFIVTCLMDVGKKR